MGRDHADADETAEKVKKALAGLQAVPRAGITDDIANTAVFLASDEAGFINGDDIVVDGGLIWGIDLNDPQGVVRPTRTLVLTGTLYNDVSSTEDLGLIGFSAQGKWQKIDIFS